MTSSASSSAALSGEVPILLYIDAEVIGGSTNYTMMLAAGLRRRGYHVTVFCKALAALEPMRQQLRAADVDVLAEDSGDHTTIGRARRLVHFFRLLRSRQRSVLLLLMGYFHGGGPLAIAARLAGVTIVLRADLQPPMPPISLWERIATRAKDRLFDLFIVGAEENVRSYVAQLGRDIARLRVVHTGIELDAFRPGIGREAVRDELRLRPEQPLVGVVSRIGDDWERKGIGVLLDALPRVAREWPDAHFVIVGDGSTRPRHEHAVRTSGLADRVTFVGWRTDTARLFAAMDVFVMPSTFEGGPTTVIEAMAMARPIVATNVGMVPEILRDGESALIIEPWSADALVTAIGRLLADPGLRSRIGARAQVGAAGLDIEHMVDGYIAECGALWSAKHKRSDGAAAPSTASPQSSDTSPTPGA